MTQTINSKTLRQLYCFFIPFFIIIFGYVGWSIYYIVENHSTNTCYQNQINTSNIILASNLYQCYNNNTILTSNLYQCYNNNTILTNNITNEPTNEPINNVYECLR